MSSAKDLLMTKSMDFAVRIVNLYKWLCNEKKEFVLSKQLLRSGTSIRANLSEAQSAISKADFAAKVYISLKESLTFALSLSETYFGAKRKRIALNQ